MAARQELPRGNKTQGPMAARQELPRGQQDTGTNGSQARTAPRQQDTGTNGSQAKSLFVGPDQRLGPNHCGDEEESVCNGKPLRPNQYFFLNNL